MEDSLGRKIDYLRISITDRCNLRCIYCMPENIELLPMEEILTYEEIADIVEATSKLGIKKIKITGGEPLVRKDCWKLVKMLKAIEGIDEVTLTTNGVLLTEQLEKLKEAGIDGINVSLDTMDSFSYKKITGFDKYELVLEGIRAAIRAGIKTKINVVSIKWHKEYLTADLIQLIELTKKYPIDVRFIEIMPIGKGKQYEFLGNDVLFNAISAKYAGIKRDNSKHGNGPAVYFKIPGFVGSIGFISAIHGKFCSDCNRLRLSASGYLKACLCFENGTNLKPIVRDTRESLKAQQLMNCIKQVIEEKPKEHNFEELEKITEHNYMASIGG